MCFVWISEQKAIISGLYNRDEECLLCVKLNKTNYKQQCKADQVLFQTCKLVSSGNRDRLL